ncbi:hypothetical protein DSM110277_03148 (plasmid) [Sulfitobacter pontiacus]|uniref:Uncharacterized protein n=1 Tax=Sulfitobacter pontiacus TaxID=60137 RepID=A0AAX3AG52_9RHOB|nr:hypothetical protein C1J04_16155 [Sulfitobacter sp. SK025]UOA24701.1 hypothetical protein DSM110277_03148 [Sulfitobacter pontiacus]
MHRMAHIFSAVDCPDAEVRIPGYGRSTTPIAHDQNVSARIITTCDSDELKRAFLTSFAAARIEHARILSRITADPTVC